MRTWVLMACIAMLSVCILGCKKNREIIHKEGLDQEFVVRNVLQDDQTSFFHVEGTARWLGDQKIKFLWGRLSGEMNMATVDVGRIDFILDEEKGIPTVKFVFYDSWLNKDADGSDAERRSALILIEFPFIPNHAVSGTTIRLNLQQYTDLMVSLLSKK